jgi:DNA-directed RNA polymerase specialized sigma24 family protein
LEDGWKDVIETKPHNQMAINYPQTRATIIDRLVAGDGSRDWNRAWEIFIEIYSPSLKQSIYYAFLKVGWTDVNDEMVQSVMSDVSFKFVKATRTFQYDPSKGKFRAFLFTIVKRCVCDYLTRYNRHPLCEIITESKKEKEPPGQKTTPYESLIHPQTTHYESLIHPQSTINKPEPPDKECMRAWKMATFRTLLEEVRERVGPQTMLIFQKTKMQLQPADAVMKELRVTRSTIDNANLRVIKLLREIVEASPLKEDLQLQ